MRAPLFTSKQKKKKQPVPRADKYPGGLSNIPPYTKNQETHSGWCSRADVATENRWTVNGDYFYSMVMVHMVRKNFLIIVMIMIFSTPFSPPVFCIIDRSVATINSTGSGSQEGGGVGDPLLVERVSHGKPTDCKYTVV
jgi:hypothetical protein